MTYDDREIVCQRGKFRVEEWEDVNYCEHCFYNGDEQLDNEEVVILLDDLTKENEQLKQQCERHRRNFRAMEDVKCELSEENNELKEAMKRMMIEMMGGNP